MHGWALGYRALKHRSGVGTPAWDAAGGSIWCWEEDGPVWVLLADNGRPQRVRDAVSLYGYSPHPHPFPGPCSLSHIPDRRQVICAFGQNQQGKAAGL